MMPRRSGYTLLELILVIVLILAAAAFAIPNIEGWVSRRRVHAEADKIKARLIEVRNLAMAEGRVYTFQIMVNGSGFKIEPEEASELTVEGAVEPTIREQQLDSGVIFVKDLEALKGSSVPAPTSTYETIVIFNPDGTAREDAQILFGTPGVSVRAVGVRGLTGAVHGIDLNTTERMP